MTVTPCESLTKFAFSTIHCNWFSGEVLSAKEPIEIRAMREEDNERDGSVHTL